MNPASIALAIALAATSCSPSVDPLARLTEADQLAADRDWPAAAKAYQQAMNGLGEAVPALEHAKRGYIKVLAATEPLKALGHAQSHIEQFVAENGLTAGPDLIGGIAGDCLEVGNLDAAALVTALGRKLYPPDHGLRNLESRLNDLTWQAMDKSFAAIGYLRQNKSQAATDLDLLDESGAVIAVGGASLLQLIDPLSYRFLVEQGYTD